MLITVALKCKVISILHHFELCSTHYKITIRRIVTQPQQIKAQPEVRVSRLLLNCLVAIPLQFRLCSKHYECKTVQIVHLFSIRYKDLQATKNMKTAGACPKYQLLNHLVAIELQFKLCSTCYCI